jgi:hypothetical protein
MARVTRVAKAQQRYETKPVLGEDGKPLKIALTKGDGSPKMTSAKRGRTPRPVFITKTERDLTRPKPNLRCDFPGCEDPEIRPGQAYMWIKPKSGPYGGSQRNRHQTHRAWHVWEYSNSLSAQVARIEHDADVDSAESEDDVTSVLNDAAEAIRDLASQKREGAENIESGFGHATYQSEELEQQADDLESWADDVEATEVEDLSSFDCQAACSDGQADCPECDGTGTAQEDDGLNDKCDDCDGSGQVECEDCDGTGYDLEAARESWAEAVQEALSACPV